MADSSSTSSSERPVKRREEKTRHRFPWALFLALAMVAAAEMVIRQLPREALVVNRDDTDQPRAVRDAIDLPGAADVAIVGSSMTYQGVNVPDLQSRLSDAVGREVSVRNYAIRGGRVDLFAETVRRLLRQPGKPRVILVGISMRDLREYDLDFDRMSLFWTPTDFAHALRDRGYGATQHLPTVFRNAVEPCYATLRYRRGITTMIERQFIDVQPEPMPALGDSPSQHTGSRRDTTLTLNEFKSRNNKRRMTQAYRIDLPLEPQPIFTQCVEEIIASCRGEGVELIFVDMPISELLRGLIINADKSLRTSEIEPAYRRTMATLCADAGVRFITSEDLNLKWETPEFYDSQHLNYQGALKLDAALVAPVAKALEAD